MLKYKLFTVYVFLNTLLCGCSEDRKKAGFEKAENEYKVELVGRLDELLIPENSGLELTDDGNLWTHSDGGHANALYKINQAGELLQTAELPGLENNDWEDIAKDNRGNLFIGDFGNNKNKRRNLRIYKLQEKTMQVTDTIRFEYPDQEQFPPPKHLRNFDCEAFLWYNSGLYLFTKNRSKSEEVKLYRLPDKSGDYRATLIGSLPISTMITAADISPDGKLVALLGYGYVYLFEVGSSDNFFEGRKRCIPIGDTGQAEGLVFVNNTDFLISNEGGKLFKATKVGEK